MKQFKHLVCYFINVSLLNSTNSKKAGMSSFLVWCSYVLVHILSCRPQFADKDLQSYKYVFVVGCLPFTSSHSGPF